MKFYVLENDGMSVKPFELWEIEAEDKEEAHEIADEGSSTNFSSCWVLTKEELNNLKEVINSK